MVGKELAGAFSGFMGGRDVTDADPPPLRDRFLTPMVQCGNILARQLQSMLVDTNVKVIY